MKKPDEEDLFDFSEETAQMNSLHSAVLAALADRHVLLRPSHRPWRSRRRRQRLLGSGCRRDGRHRSTAQRRHAGLHRLRAGCLHGWRRQHHRRGECATEVARDCRRTAQHRPSVAPRPAAAAARPHVSVRGAVRTQLESRRNAAVRPQTCSIIRCRRCSRRSILPQAGRRQCGGRDSRCCSSPPRKACRCRWAWIRSPSCRPGRVG